MRKDTQEVAAWEEEVVAEEQKRTTSVEAVQDTANARKEDLLSKAFLVKVSAFLISITGSDTVLIRGGH